MKKILAILIAMILTAMPVVMTLAAEVTADNHKESLQSYADSKLKYKTKELYNFDSMDGIWSSNNGRIDTEDKKEGTGSLSVNFGTGSFTAFEMRNGAIDFGISNNLKETVKFWVYINNIDLLKCDHDDVYDTPQYGSGTIYVSFAKDDTTRDKYSLQHTLEGNGWHLVEISFATRNISYESWQNLDISKLGWMKVTVSAMSGLVMKFDGLEKYTYSNDGYTKPEAPNNGRWLSTCDYESLDGNILSEWYASSFDKSEKVQGSSSLSLTGKKQHVDYRAVWGGLDVQVNKGKDVLHFDIYISDLDAIGKVLQARLSHNESGTTTAVYSFDYNTANAFANGSEGFKQGWNSVDIPLLRMTSSISDSFGPDFKFVIEHIVFFWEGAYTDKEYTVKYDNMYVYERAITEAPEAGTSGGLSISDEKAAQIAQDIIDKKITSHSSYAENDIAKIKAKLQADHADYVVTFNEDGSITVTESKDAMITYIIIIAAALVVVLAVVILIIVIAKRKKKTDVAAPASSKPKAE